MGPMVRRGHFLCKEEMATHFNYALAYHFHRVCKDLHPRAVQQGCSVLEPKGVLSRESLPHPQGRRGFELHFLILAFGQAYPCSYNVILLRIKRCVAGGSNRGTHRVNLWLVLQWRSCIFFGGAAEETPRIHFRSLALAQSLTISHNVVLGRNCVILCRQLLGGSFELIRRSVFE